MMKRCVLLFVAYAFTCSRSSTAAAITRSATTPASNSLKPSLISEGALQGIQIAPTAAEKPGSNPGFYNPKRRIGRDFVVLGVAHWLADRAVSCSDGLSDSNSRRLPRSARVLDATCATGIQGLRTVVESPLLAEAILSQRRKETDTDSYDDKKHKNGEPEILPELQVVLNDSDECALSIARHNTNHVLTTTNTTTLQHHPDRITLTQRVAQSLLHEQSFEISILDPFGAIPPFLDAALSRSPNGGLLEFSATDVGVTYGTRPSVAARHYGVRLGKKRPPCYRERGVRILLAAVAQAAGRWDRGIEVVFGLSTEHYCLVSVRVVRGKNAADETAGLVQSVRICRTCGAVGAGTTTTTKGCSNGEGNFVPNPPRCGCEPIDGAGTDAREEGPLWIGPLYDVDAVRTMADISRRKEA